MNKKYQIAIDSDGVIANFEKKVDQIMNGPWAAISKGKIWSSIEKYDKNVEPFFESLEKMPDADMLVNYIMKTFDDYFVLTASGYTPKNCVEQKQRWYKKYYPNLKVVIVPKSSDKAQYATPNTILIDDREKSLIPWKNAGGIGILHTSALDTINQLNNLIR